MKDSIEMWNDAAKSLEFQQNYEGTAACYERAKAFGDESPECSLNRAVSYIQLYGIYKQDRYLNLAKEALISAIDADSRNGKLHLYLGQVYLSLGEERTAVDEFFYAEEIKSEQDNELLLGFDLPLEAPTVYETPKSEVYELLPDPTLHKIFDLVRSFPMDSSLYESLKETYGQKDSASLLALYLRSIYMKVFEDKAFASEVGLMNNPAKWEALLVFFVRGINQDTKALVKSSLSSGKMDISAMPAYTRLLLGRYRGEVASSSYNSEGFRALLLLPMKKLDAINAACEISRKAKEEGEGKKQMEKIYTELSKTGMANKKNGYIAFSETLASPEETERIGAKLASRTYDREFFIVLRSLLVRKRFGYAMDLAKKIRALYEQDEATSYIKELLSKIALTDEERFQILSEA